jgi:hypothetical protein
MEAKNFRIGNLVEEPKGCTHKIERIDETSTRVRHGLRITEAHLLGFGFKKHKLGNAHWYTKSCGKHKPELITNDIGKDAYSTKLQFVFMDTYDNIKLRYVHQVQNLFFALTGRELEMKVERSTCG